MFSLRGPPLTLFFFSFRSASQSRTWTREGAPNQSPRLPLITRATWNPPPGKLQSWKRSGAPHLTHSLHPWGSGSKRNRRPERNTRATGLPGRTRAPPGPPPTGGPVHCLRCAGCLPARCIRGSQAQRPPAGRRLAAAPVPSSASMSPISASPRRGPVDSHTSRAHCPAAATPATERECEQSPACPSSSLSGDSAVGARASCSASLD